MNAQNNVELEQNTLELQAQQASDFLRMLGNHHRLSVLCLLMEHGELSVSQILEHTTLSQSALSQHLAKMREQGLINYRRASQSLLYYIQDEKVIQLLQVLKTLFCPTLDK